jgi:hypothetical protein
MTPSTIPALVIAGAILTAPALFSRGESHSIEVKIARTVDLGVPGALDSIATSNPGHYRKLVGIIEAAGEIDCEEMPAKLYVKYGALGSCTAPHMFLTSYPAKRHLSFTLDDTSYVVNVAIRGKMWKVIPAGAP